MSDKKWMIVLAGFILLFGFWVAKFALETGKIHNIVEQLRSKGEVADKGRMKHIVLIEQEQNHPYWNMVEDGATAAADEFGIEVEFHGPFRYSMEEQLKLLEKAIASKVDGIIVQGLNDTSFAPVINKAVDKGIPVLTVDTDAPTSKRFAYVGTDNVDAGRMLGKLVTRWAGETAKIGVIIGSETAESQQQRLAGFRSVIEGKPGLEIAAVGASDISMIEAIQQASDMLKKHPDINVMVGTSAMDALGILQAKKSLRRDDVKIIGFDNVNDTLAALQQGEIIATVAQQPYEMGYHSVRLLHEFFLGKEPPPAQYTPLRIIETEAVGRGPSL